jgi:hypothetical protein
MPGNAVALARDALVALALADPDEWVAMREVYEPGIFPQQLRAAAEAIVALRHDGAEVNPRSVSSVLERAGNVAAARAFQGVIAQARVIGDGVAVLRLLAQAKGDEGGGAVSGLGMAERPCNVARLREREKLRFLPLGDLPEQHGWGDFMDKLTGGGIAPGSIVGVGAAGTGAGKTAFLMQLLDGLALRSALAAEDPDATAPLTPVLIASEMDREDLECRTLGRLLDVPGHVFAAGESAKRFHKWGWVEEQFNRAEQLMKPGGLFARLVKWQHVARPSLTGPAMVRELEQHADEWVKRIRSAHPGREVIPVIAVDPINRFLPLDGRSEVDTLGEIASLLDELADRRRWVVLVSADTNKTAAKDPTDASAGAAVFRGTMQLLHAFDLTLVLAADKPDPDGVAPYQVTIDKNRHGRSGVTLQFRWHTKTGLRFVAETEEEWKKRSGESSKPRDEEARRRLLDTVATLTSQGVVVTRESLKGHAQKIGVAKNTISALVDVVVARQELAESTRTGRGGGRMLTPTGKSLGSVAGNSPGNSPGELDQGPRATSGELGELTQPRETTPEELAQGTRPADVKIVNGQ